MADKLIQHLRKFVDIPEEARELVLSSFTSLKVKKKENILENGNICKCNYFVVSGCFACFLLMKKALNKPLSLPVKIGGSQIIPHFSTNNPVYFLSRT